MKQWVLSLAVLAGSVQTTQAQGPAALEPVHWLAQAQVPNGVHVGSRFAVLLHAKIDDGWHLYALPDSDSFPLATEIGLAKTPSADLVRVEEAKPHRSVDPESHVVTSWFAQSATFTLRLVATADTPRDLQVLVRYQACNERMCLPARQVMVPAPLSATQ